MKKILRKQSGRKTRPAPSDWRNSQTLFLLNCYDVWSATPPRGCDCRGPVPAAA